MMGNMADVNWTLARFQEAVAATPYQLKRSETGFRVTHDVIDPTNGQLARSYAVDVALDPRGPSAAVQEIGFQVSYSHGEASFQPLTAKSVNLATPGQELEPVRRQSTQAVELRRFVADLLVQQGWKVRLDQAQTNARTGTYIFLISMMVVLAIVIVAIIIGVL